MSTPISITADKDLIEALQRPICNPIAGHSRSEDTFCLSNPENWPDAPTVGDVGQVELEYPSTASSNSLPGTEFFCTDYLNWLGRIAPTGPHTHEPVSYLREIDPSGENADRYVDGMEKLSDFCRSVQDAGSSEDDDRHAVQAAATPPPAPPDGGATPSPSGNGIVDFINDHATAIISALTAAGALLSAAAVAVRKFQTGVASILRAVVAWENISKIFSGKGEPLRPSALEVLDQLKETAPDFFKGLESEVEKYVVDQAIEKFGKQWAITQKIHLYLEAEDAPKRGLPWSHIKAYAKRTLTAKNRAALRDEAALSIASNIDAKVVESKVIKQLIAKKSSVQNESRDVQKALYLFVMSFWRTRSENEQIASIDLTRPFEYGELPQNIIDLIVTDENIEVARSAAAADTPRSNDGNGSGGPTPTGGSSVTGLAETGEVSSGGGAGTPQGTLHRIASSLRIFWGARAPQVSHRAFMGARVFAMQPVRVAPPIAFRVPVR